MLSTIYLLSPLYIKKRVQFLFILTEHSDKSQEIRSSYQMCHRRKKVAKHCDYTTKATFISLFQILIINQKNPDTKIHPYKTRSNFKQKDTPGFYDERTKICFYYGGRNRAIIKRELRERFIEFNKTKKGRGHKRAGDVKKRQKNIK